MRVVVVGLTKEVTRVALVFQRAGHRVRKIRDTNELETASSRVMDVAITSYNHDKLRRFTEVVRKSGVYCYTMAVLDADEAELRAEALACEVDAIIPPGASQQELAAHVQLAERIVGFDRHFRGRIDELERMLGGMISSADEEYPESRALLTKSWNGIENLMARTCSEYLQMAMRANAGTSLPSKPMAGATIPLTDVGHGLQLDVSVFCPEASRHHLATAFCGGDESLVDEEIMHDVVLELANSVTGAVKTEFFSEEFVFTVGIPRDVTSDAVVEEMTATDAYRVIEVHGTNVSLHVLAALRRNQRVRIPGAGLREGMVLATDLLTDKGLLLAKAGTRLTETSAQKLARLAPNALVDLAVMQ